MGKPEQALQIGPYTIEPFPGNQWWIQHDSGEGMEVKNIDLIVAIERLWKEKF